jgi:hypothetical protein
MHESQKVYPSMQDDITLTSGSGAAWTLGDFTMVIQAAENTRAFDIHYININNMDIAGIYEFVFYAVDDDLFSNPVETGRARVSNGVGFVSKEDKRFQGPILSAGQRVAIKIAHSTTSEATCKVSLAGHQYAV